MREIGPIGTVSRFAVGVVATALPIALEGLTWWDALGWVALALLAIAISRPVLLAVERYSAGANPRELRACSAAACAIAALLFGASIAIGVATPAEGDVVFWGFVGMSMLLAAARGDGGCELLAFPNLVMRRRDRVGCIIFTPIDHAEATRNSSARSNPVSRHEAASR